MSVKPGGNGEKRLFEIAKILIPILFALAPVLVVWGRTSSRMDNFDLRHTACEERIRTLETEFRRAVDRGILPTARAEVDALKERIRLLEGKRD